MKKAFLLPFLFFLVNVAVAHNSQSIYKHNSVLPAESTENIPLSKNVYQKVAVLPVNLITDITNHKEDLALRIQLSCYNALSEKAKQVEYLYPTDVNAVLLKKGISYDDVKMYTIKELCDLLDVDYVVQTFTTINVVSSSYSSQEKTTRERGERNTVISGQESVNYSTTVLLNVFDREGKKVFGQDRRSLWPLQDGYRNTLNYLAKRTPLYKK